MRRWDQGIDCVFARTNAVRLLCMSSHTFACTNYIQLQSGSTRGLDLCQGAEDRLVVVRPAMARRCRGGQGGSVTDSSKLFT